MDVGKKATIFNILLFYLFYEINLYIKIPIMFTFIFPIYSTLLKNLNM